MNLKRIALSLASAGTAGTLLVGGTFAFFTDQGTSSGNVFSAGTVIMKLSDSNETDQDNVTATWGFTNAVPGNNFTGTLSIKNNGTVDAGTIDFDFGNVVVNNPDTTSPGNVATTPMDKVIQISKLEWDDDGDGLTPLDLLSSVNDLNGNSIKDLDDLENTTLDNVNYDESPNETHTLVMEGTFHNTLATNEHQGDTVTTTLNITLDQQP